MSTEASNVSVEDQTNNNVDSESESPIATKAKSENQGSEDTNTEDQINDSSALEKEEKDDKQEPNNDDDQDDNGNQESDDVAEDGEDTINESNELASLDEAEKTNLIVNYLPQQMTDEEFKDLFTKFGEMKSCKIVRNRMTGASYGFGFVDFGSHEQALKAIDELNGHELADKKIKVAFARPAGSDIKQANLYVKNIPLSWSQDDVRKAFESYGNIIQVRVLSNPQGVAFVLYDLRKQAEDALEAMQGKQLDGAEEPLDIKFAADKKGGERKRGSRRGGRNERERSNQGGPRNSNNNNNNNNNNNRNNRSQSDTRNRSQLRGNSRSHSNQRGGNNNDRQNNNMNGNNSSNNIYNNNGFGPIRHQQTNRLQRFTPFATTSIQTPAMTQHHVAPMAGYGAYAGQTPMYPYMMQQPMLQTYPTSTTATAATTGQPMAGAASMIPMSAYQMPQAPQMTTMGYQAPAVMTAQSAMYNMASSTMQNAAQMQPQLGQPMNQARTGQSYGGGGSNNGPQDGVTLFVYNIGPQSDEDELRTMFSPYGQVLRCNVVRKSPGGDTKGYGFVTLKDRDQANKAIASLNGSPRNGKTLQVSFRK